MVLIISHHRAKYLLAHLDRLLLQVYRSNLAIGYNNACVRGWPEVIFLSSFLYLCPYYSLYILSFCPWKYSVPNPTPTISSCILVLAYVMSHSCYIVRCIVREILTLLSLDSLTRYAALHVFTDQVTYSLQISLTSPLCDIAQTVGGFPHSMFILYYCQE